MQHFDFLDSFSSQHARPSWFGPRSQHGHGGRHGHGSHAGGRHGHGGEGGGHRGRTGRYFGRGDLRLVLLSLIAEKPRHGYELIRSIAESSGGIYRPSPGVVYPTLTLLEDLGQVRTTLDADQRRVHAITAEGKAYLDAHRVTLEEMKARMPGRRTAEVEAQVREIHAAMDTLKQALRSTLGHGPVDAKRLARTVAAIEKAAREISASDAP